MERISHQFTNLFQVHILHHYWLDEGATVFDQIDDTPLKEQRLLRYNVQNILEIIPSAETTHLLRQYGARCIQTSIGFIVTASDSIILESDAVFSFYILIKDPSFFIYTPLTLQPQKLHQITNLFTGEKIVFKSGVFVFSNLHVEVNSGINYLTTKYASAGSGPYQAESIVQHNGIIYQANGDTTEEPPHSDWQEIGPLGTSPAFVQQNDIPLIESSPEWTGAPARGIKMQPDTPTDVYAVIRIERLGNGAPFGLYDNDNKPASPKFEIRFRNRMSFREERNARTGVSISISTQPHGLTFFKNSEPGSFKPSTQNIHTELTSSEEIKRVISITYR